MAEKPALGASRTEMKGTFLSGQITQHVLTILEFLMTYLTDTMLVNYLELK